MSESMKTTLNELCQKDIATASDAELYTALLKLVQEQSQKQIKPVTGRKLYYISAEFLIGKLLSNNLINLGLYDEVRETLASVGKSLADIEEQEPEPSLGNGGLGRLAACFLDSLATLNLPGDGVGLRYHCGLFHQNFKNNIQNETPDFWLTDQCSAKATDTVFPVSLAGNTYSARLYKLPVTGYEGRTNMLNLFDLDSVDESVIGDGISLTKKILPETLHYSSIQTTPMKTADCFVSISSISWFLPVLSLFSTNVLHVDVTIMTLPTMQLSKSMIHTQVW